MSFRTEKVHLSISELPSAASKAAMVSQICCCSYRVHVLTQFILLQTPQWPEDAGFNDIRNYYEQTSSTQLTVSNTRYGEIGEDDTQAFCELDL